MKKHQKLEEKIRKNNPNNIKEKTISWYFSPKNFETKGTLYENLGVKKFEKIYVPLSKKYLKKKEKNRKNSPCYIIEEGKKIEISHQIINSLLLSTNLFIGNEIFLYTTLISTIPTNIYPIMMQRYIRGRIYKRLNKIKEKQQSTYEYLKPQIVY